MIVLKQGRVLDPSRNLDETADIVIEKGCIVACGRDAGAQHKPSQDVEIIELQGHWVVPGFIDLHVHFREPGEEYKEDIHSGLMAAAKGGFTAVCAMPNTRPINDNRAITEMMIATSKAQKGPRLYPIGALTRKSEGAQLSDIGELRHAGAVGLSDDGKCVLNANIMRRALEYAKTFDLLVSQHAEDHTMTAGAQMNEGVISTRLGLRGWPREAEDIIVARDLILAEMTGGRYHVAHISSLGAVRLLKEAKSRGLQVSAEVTPHHLTLTDEALVTYNTACKVNPPLRSAEDREALIEALKDGTIDCIATDHAPHSTLEKDCEFSKASPGMIGLETVVPLMLDLVRKERLSPLRLFEALSTRPANIGKVEGGTLRAGSTAHITVIDPSRDWTLSASTLVSKSKNTPFLDKKMQGGVHMTIVSGEIVFRDSVRTNSTSGC